MGREKQTLATPVAFFVFNRPEHTRQSFQMIREQRPANLFIVADGPRPHQPGDQAWCSEVRDIVSGIDWPCDVRREYSDHNLGLKTRVSSGLEWVFSQVDRAIVLEDDCVAHQDFFRFCEALLDRYQDDLRIAAITGDNFQDGIRRGDASYYYSKYNHVWGWATWKRAWKHYELSMSFWPAWRDTEAWSEWLPDPIERRYWEEIFDRTYHGEIDTWDYQWTASAWHSYGLTATPNTNLVTNIGFGPRATHTKEKTSAASVPVVPLKRLTHPATVELDAVADAYTFDRHFVGAALRRRRLPSRLLRPFAVWMTRIGHQRSIR